MFHVYDDYQIMKIMKAADACVDGRRPAASCTKKYLLMEFRKQNVEQLSKFGATSAAWFVPSIP